MYIYIYMYMKYTCLYIASVSLHQEATRACWAIACRRARRARRAPVHPRCHRCHRCLRCPYHHPWERRRRRGDKRGFQHGFNFSKIFTQDFSKMLFMNEVRRWANLRPFRGRCRFVLQETTFSPWILRAPSKRCLEKRGPMKFFISWPCQFEYPKQTVRAEAETVLKQVTPDTDRRLSAIIEKVIRLMQVGEKPCHGIHHFPSIFPWGNSKVSNPYLKSPQFLVPVFRQEFQGLAPQLSRIPQQAPVAPWWSFELYDSLLGLPQHTY